MNHLARKSKAVALAAAVLPLLAVAGCGGSSKSGNSGSGGANGSFVSQANAICAGANTTVGSVYESVGEQYKVASAPWAAGTDAGVAVAARHAVASLQALKPPSSDASNFRTFVSDEQQAAALLSQEQSAATSGNGSTYQTLESKRTSLIQSAQNLAGQIGLAACANNSLSSSDKAQITHVISSTATSNVPNECTQDFTMAFIKQNWGSMAACVQNAKQTGSHDTKSVDVIDVKGAGNFATADTTLHLASGQAKNLSVAVYRPHGSWLLLGFQSK